MRNEGKRDDRSRTYGAHTLLIGFVEDFFFPLLQLPGDEEVVRSWGAFRLFGAIWRTTYGISSGKRPDKEENPPALVLDLVFVLAVLVLVSRREQGIRKGGRGKEGRTRTRHDSGHCDKGDGGGKRKKSVTEASLK
jgi:hypothetical protein